jgi:FRG domain
VALQEHSVSDVSSLVAYILTREPAVSSWFRGQGCSERSLDTSLSRKLTSKDPDHLLEVERRLITRFRQRSLSLWPEGYPQKDWEHLFAMQHFGVPTRLLDWSESLMVGLYFAADHDPERCECRTGNCQPTLWVVDPAQLNHHNSRLEGMDKGILATSDQAADPWAPGVTVTQFAPWPIALYGTHNSPRIVAQQGTFTVSGKDPKPLEESNTVIAHDGVLEKIVIDTEHEELRRQLKILGIRRATVYPDLPGLAHDISDEEVF